MCDGNNIIITNTCAYDSIIQIFASAFSDSEECKKYVNSLLSLNNIFQIIRNVALGSITSRAYKLHALIIKPFCESSHLPNKILQIKGECIAKYAVEKLFLNFPSIKETRKCSRNGCYFNFVIHRPVLSITILLI